METKKGWWLLIMHPSLVLELNMCEAHEGKLDTRLWENSLSKVLRTQEQQTTFRATWLPGTTQIWTMSRQGAQLPGEFPMILCCIKLRGLFWSWGIGVVRKNLRSHWGWIFLAPVKWSLGVSYNLIFFIYWRIKHCAIFLGTWIF